MKKKTVISIAVIVVCLALAVVAVASTSSMKIVVEFKNNSTTAADELVTAVVSVKGYNTEMAGLQYGFTYNTENFVFVKAEIDPDFYNKTVKFSEDPTQNETYASYAIGDVNPYFSVEEKDGTGTLRFVSIAEAGSYADLGTNFTLFTVTLKAKGEVTPSTAVKPSTDFNLLGAPVTEQGETSSLEIPSSNFTADEIKNAITNLQFESYKTATKFDPRNITVSLINSAKQTVKTIKVNESDLVSKDSSYLSELLLFSNVDVGTYSIKIEKQYCKPIVINNIVISESNNVLNLLNTTLPKLVIYGGDVNSDSFIDITDVAMLVSDFGVGQSSATDINGDGYVDITDIAMVVQNFGVIAEYNLQ